MSYRGRLYTSIATVALGCYSIGTHYLIEKAIHPWELGAWILGLIVAFLVGKKFDEKTYHYRKQLLEKQTKLEELNDQINHVFHNIEAGIWFVNVNNGQGDVSAGLGEIFGVDPNVFRRNFHIWKEMIHPDDKDIIKDVEQAILTKEKTSFQYRIARSSGEVRWVENRIRPQRNEENEVSMVYGVIFDITEQKNAQDKMKYMAYHDMLTGLPNRYKFTELLEESLGRCKRGSHNLAVMMIDLDRFKFVNDTMGHNQGDILLKLVTDRILKRVRKQDVVARQGGDEFIILLEDVHKGEVKEVAEQILTGFTTSFLLEKEEFFTSPSIGISMYPHDGQDLKTLIKHADTAMYLAKKRGKNNYQFYEYEDKHILDRRTKIERDLKKALRNKEFYLHYQPKLNLVTEEIYGVEALIRWKHPELGIISPIEFISIAEETEMVVPLGKWVLKEACRQNKEWQQSSDVRVKVAVNISAIQFEANGFVEEVKEVLREVELAPEYLGLEITESVMQNTKRSSAIIHELKQYGIKISIDDFGTGYSSLSVLNQLPIDLVKIDKTFISEIISNSNTASLVKTMIEMGRNFDFDLIAEGIEDEQQAAFLIQNGCKYGQGYYYSPPLPAPEVEKLLTKLPSRLT
ncbi:putative bifunctional diguanylate cyclase/phosphodiesterase [Halalkalibacter okhensis]|uniref:putative bifunctional diguanylate cyclase/phosphodiesterase n=1 Tax=Halalkalibacter okhensis TaxID=333138 RepID=UPI00068AFAED|nr:GGDEF domain-containing phosphodiesterase [Halalkalibacter okhensis]